MEEPILKDFIIIQRDIFRMYESGKISYTELVVFEWLNYIADKYGYAHIRSYSWLSERLPLGIKGNTVGVVMRSLRNHKFIEYSDRQGSRRGFKVKIGYWPTGNGMFRRLGDTEDEQSINLPTSGDTLQSQVGEEVRLKNHKLPILNNSAKTEGFTDNVAQLITSHKNDIEKKKENKSIDMSITNKEGDCIYVSGFNSTSGEQETLRRVAELCEEPCMNYLLGKYKRHGQQLIRVLSRCEMLYKEADLQKLDNKPAFMNSLVEQELKSIDLGN